MPNPIDVVEALLFASDAPLEAERIREVLDLETADAAHDLVAALTARYDEHGRGLAIMEVAGGYRMVTRPELAPWLVRLARARTRVRLSRPALETLAIVAYKQPITAPEIQEIRGVNPSAILASLLDRRLIRILGRKKVVGKPFVYGTTRDFLIRFGLNSVEDLPSMEEFEAMLQETGDEPPPPSGDAPALEGTTGTEQEPAEP